MIVMLFVRGSGLFAIVLLIVVMDGEREGLAGVRMDGIKGGAIFVNILHHHLVHI